jgi:hypothetical protein
MAKERTFLFFQNSHKPLNLPSPLGGEGIYIVSSPKGERIEVRGDLSMKHYESGM